MVSSVLAVTLAAMIVTINGQSMFPGLLSAGMPGAMGGGMTGGMPMGLPPSQSQNLMQQFFFYRLMFGDAAARLIVADRMANMMGGNMLSRYYAGEYFDTPDTWWLTSSLMNRNNMAAGGNMGLPTSGATNPAAGAMAGGSI